MLKDLVIAAETDSVTDRSSTGCHDETKPLRRLQVVGRDRVNVGTEGVGDAAGDGPPKSRDLDMNVSWPVVGFETDDRRVGACSDRNCIGSFGRF